MCDIDQDLNFLPAAERNALIAIGEMLMCSGDIQQSVTKANDLPATNVAVSPVANNGPTPPHVG